eukprot:1962056-Pyramimonas_sp.AAC.1
MSPDYIITIFYDLAEVSVSDFEFQGPLDLLQVAWPQTTSTPWPRAWGRFGEFPDAKVRGRRPRAGGPAVLSALVLAPGAEPDDVELGVRVGHVNALRCAPRAAQVQRHALVDAAGVAAHQHHQLRSTDKSTIGCLVSWEGAWDKKVAMQRLCCGRVWMRLWECRRKEGDADVQLIKVDSKKGDAEVE